MDVVARKGVTTEVVVIGGVNFVDRRFGRVVGVVAGSKLGNYGW